MSAGSKLSLAVIVLFAALLGVYYGLGGPGVGRASDTPAGDGQPAAPKLHTVVTSDWPSRPAAKTPPAAVHPVNRPGTTASPATSPASPWSAPNVPTTRPATSPGDRGSDGIRLLTLGQRRPKDDKAQTPAGGHEFYTVQGDDSMWIIARKWLGNGARWEEIARLNPGIDPDHLDVGMKLRMPQKVEPEKAATEPAGPAAPDDGSTIHTVAEGDSLATIAAKYLGAGHRWEVIYQANRDVIGNDPHALKIGMKLRIPKQ